MFPNDDCKIIDCKKGLLLGFNVNNAQVTIIYTLRA